MRDEIRDVRDEIRRSEDRIISKFNIPSINEIEFELRNENVISQNFIEPVMRGEDDWRSNPRDYQSILELNSDIFFRYHV